jgi:hypothetical protein
LSKVQKFTQIKPTIGEKEVRDFIKTIIRTPANITQNLDLIKTQNPQLHAQILQEILGLLTPLSGWVPNIAISSWATARGKAYFSDDRFKHHQAKSGMRLAESHFGDMQSLKPTATAQKTTEVRGEFATAAGILHFLSLKYQFKEGYSASGHHGVDQVWVERNRSTGEVKTYLIVEAKGSELAKLGQTVNKGEQMSPFWVVVSLAELYSIGNERQQHLVVKLIESMTGVKTYLSVKAAKTKTDKPSAFEHGVAKNVTVKAIVVQARPTNGLLNVKRLDDYVV